MSKERPQGNWRSVMTREVSSSKTAQRQVMAHAPSRCMRASYSWAHLQCRRALCPHDKVRYGSTRSRRDDSQGPQVAADVHDPSHRPQSNELPGVARGCGSRGRTPTPATRAWPCVVPGQRRRLLVLLHLSTIAAARHPVKAVSCRGFEPLFRVCTARAAAAS
jgi:hypothetical protein